MSSNLPTISRTQSNHSAVSVSPNADDTVSSNSPQAGSGQSPNQSTSGSPSHTTRLNRSATTVKGSPHNPHHSKRTFSMSDTLNLTKLPSNLHLHENGQGGMNSPMTTSITASLHQLGEGAWSNRVEDFEIRKPIGYGSSAVVYSAVYKPLHKRIAIKIIDLDLFERNQIDELRRETALMALSKHTNVLRVYGSFVSGSKLYIVTPYLSGGSCLDIMKTSFVDGFDEISIATILKQALEGLIYLHKNGHIHRDVKAGNLLMDEDGTVLLADFGVSSSLVENGDNGLRKTFVGTPCWMAPEVMEQAGYDYKADIWSFGITAIELATGHAPFAKFPPMKTLLTGIPPLDQRPHRKVPQKHHSITKTTDWDFDGDDNAEEAPKEATETHEKEGVPIINTSSVTFAPEPVSSQPSTPATPSGNMKRHISFGDAVVKSPSPSSSPGQSTHPTQPTAVSSQAPELVVPTAIAPRKSRFVIEDSSSEFGNTLPYGVPLAHSPSISHSPSASPDLKESGITGGLYSNGSSASNSNQMLVGLGMAAMPNGSSNQGSGYQPSQASETEVKKGRFSVNQSHRGGTPTNEQDTWTDKSISRSGSQDNLEPKDRKSRFEIQHNQQQQQQQQLPTSSSQVRFETVPLSRENSHSQHSLHRDGHGKMSRFSVEPTSQSGRSSRESSKDREAHGSEAGSAGTTSVECRKKGRFELTGGSSGTPMPASQLELRPDKIDTQYHESGHSSASGSPSTSPSSSISRGQMSRLSDSRLADPGSAHILTAHLEALLKQNETQRMILTDLYGGMSTPSSSISRSRAGSQSRPAAFHAFEPIESKPLSSSSDLLFGMEQLQQKMQAVLRDNESLHRENENLRRELERLRRSASATVINTASGSSAVPINVPAPSTPVNKHPTPPEAGNSNPQN
ncbi:hypothetical protein NQZ79_g4227 [Umbelopsis isabellina]|nr:hypothetical protein NQZ79_g4227 [Umbelopsis isabellina]